MGQDVGAYRTGIVRHLPDPPVGPFDSDRVDASDHADRGASSPDGLMRVLTHAVRMSVASPAFTLPEARGARRHLRSS